MADMNEMMDHVDKVIAGFLEIMGDNKATFNLRKYTAESYMACLSLKNDIQLIGKVLADPTYQFRDKNDMGLLSVPPKLSPPERE